MANQVLTNAKVTLNSVDLSNHVRKINFQYTAESKDNTAMGNVAHSSLAGLKGVSFDIEFNNDWAASNVDATIFPLVGAAAFTYSIVPVNATVTTTNPAYEGSCIVLDYPVFSQAVGDLAVTNVKFVGTTDCTRRTS